MHVDARSTDLLYEADRSRVSRLAPPVREVSYVRTGTFSGSAISLRTALESRLRVADLNLYDHAHNASLFPARACAMLEARRGGEKVPWPKTAAWAKANQRFTERRYNVWSRPAVIVQTMCGFVPPVGCDYVLYTDRVAQEGAATDPAFRPGFTEQWAARESKMVQAAKHIFVMGPSTADVLTGLYGIGPSRLTVIGAAPNFDLTRRQASPMQQRVLFVGTQWELKGGPELLEAFTALRHEYPDATLKIVGCSPRVVMPEGVSIVGRIPSHAMNSLYDHADLLCLPTRSEAFGIAYVEALQKGIPCVGTTVGNIPWIVGDAGICVKPADPVALFEGLRSAFRSYDSLMSRAAERGEMLRDTYSWTKIAALILRHLVT